MARAPDIKTPLCRVAFTQGLWELQTTDRGGKQWSCSLLFPKGTNIAALHENALAAAVEEWGDKAAQMIKDKLIHSPFLDGDGPQGKSKKTGEPHAGFPGNTFIRVISGEDYRPKLVNQKVLPITSKDELYSGCYGYAVVNAFTWENKEKGKGISFGISMFQKAKDGERLGGGGGGNPEDHFEKIEDEGDAPAATKTGAGAEGLFG
ncbi:MAG: ssDNA-binding protein [Parvibaculaceae bacterium]